MTKALLLGAALLGLMSAPALAQAGAAIGVNAAIRNQVEMKPAGAAAFRPAVARELVHLGDSVQSGANSALQILLKDRSVFTIGANARMTLDRFVYDPARGTGDVAATVAKGAFRFMSGKALARGGNNTIRTAVASIGVRGTIVEGAVGPEANAIAASEPGLRGQVQGGGDDATIIVLRGPGPSTNGLDKPGEIDVTVVGGAAGAAGTTTTVSQPGQAIYIGGAEQPAVTFTISPAGVESIGTQLRTNPPQSSPDTGPPVQTADTSPTNVTSVIAGGDPVAAAGGTAGSSSSGAPTAIADALGPSAIYAPTANDFPVTPATDPSTPCPPGRFCPK